MKKKRIYHLLLLCFFVPFSSAKAQESWDLETNEQGIAVYSRRVPEIPVKQIKVECELPGTPGQLVRIIKDVENHSDWVYLNKKSELLKSKGENALIYYTITDMPWPVQDRDMVAETKVMPTGKNKPVRVEVSNLPSYLPEKSHLVRIPYSMAVWEITPLPQNKIKVVYTFSVDPGGSLPAWMVNNFIETGPHITFSRLRELLTKQQAQKSK